MKTRNLVLGTALLLPLLAVTQVEAQRVRADISIGGGPVAGRVILGDRGGYGGQRLGGIEWIRSRDYRRNDWWGEFERDSRLVVVYFDPYDDSYYLDRIRPDLIELRLFERGGHYYRLEEDGYGFPGYIRGYSVPRYQPRYQVPRYNQRYETPRYDPRNDRRNDNRRDGQWDNRRDDQRGGRQDEQRGGRQDAQRGGRQDDQRGSRSRGDGRADHRDNQRGGHRTPGGNQ